MLLARALLVGAPLLVLCPGCYAAHERDPVADTTCDPTIQPVCVRRADPCAPPIRVTPTCGDDDEWRCVDSFPFAPTWGGARCVPMLGEVQLLTEAPLPVAVGDRCRWNFGHAVDASGGELRNVMIDLPETCESAAWPTDPRSAIEPPPDADIISAQAAFVDGSGTTRVLLRGWAFDATAPFGVADRGVGLGAVRGERVELASGWLFGPETDLGDAAFAWEGHAYAYGCPGAPEWIEEDCIVGRAPLGELDDAASWLRFDGSGWSDAEPVRVFGSGPHRGPVFEDPRGRGFVHLYAVGFGTRIEVTRAARPEGPWGPASVLVECELPEGDEGAYCAGPNAHLELWDPTQPSSLWVSYSIGTTSSDGDALRRADPEGYWTRIVRVRF